MAGRDAGASRRGHTDCDPPCASSRCCWRPTSAGPPPARSEPADDRRVSRTRPAAARQVDVAGPALAEAAQTTVPNTRPMPAVSAMASAPQKVTRNRGAPDVAPPARAPIAPSSARKSSEATLTHAHQPAAGATTTMSRGKAAPSEKVAAEVRRPGEDAPRSHRKFPVRRGHVPPGRPWSSAAPPPAAPVRDPRRGQHRSRPVRRVRRRDWPPVRRPRARGRRVR